MKIPAKAVDSSLVGIFAYITVKVRYKIVYGSRKQSKQYPVMPAWYAL